VPSSTSSRGLPAAEAKESEAFLDPNQAPESSQVYLDNIPFIRAVPHIDTWPEIEDVVNGLLEEAYYEPTGSGEAGELVLTILDRTAPLFERAGGG
jgi:multiple sugar transport system substrate-binding protein